MPFRWGRFTLNPRKCCPSGRGKMSETYQAAWTIPLEDCLSRHEAGKPVFAFLHPPKTGGSTIRIHFRFSAECNFVSLPLSYHPPHNYNEEFKYNILRLPKNNKETNLGSIINIGHEDFDSVYWLRRYLERNDFSLDTMYITVRPVRERIVSIFRDYWTQVRDFELGGSEDPELTPGSRRALENYYHDSKHYRDAAGKIDGRGWFKTFGEYGGGIEFYMDEIFGGSLKRFKNEILSGALKPVRTGDINPFIRFLTGKSGIEHRRVSDKGGNGAVSAAIAEAGDLIDNLCERDLPYDDFIETYLLSCPETCPWLGSSPAVEPLADRDVHRSWQNQPGQNLSGQNRSGQN